MKLYHGPFITAYSSIIFICCNVMRSLRTMHCRPVWVPPHGGDHRKCRPSTVHWRVSRRPRASRMARGYVVQSGGPFRLRSTTRQRAATSRGGGCVSLPHPVSHHPATVANRVRLPRASSRSALRAARADGDVPSSTFGERAAKLLQSGAVNRWPLTSQSRPRWLPSEFARRRDARRDNLCCPYFANPAPLAPSTRRIRPCNASRSLLLVF